MGHEEEIARLEPAVVQRMVVDMTEDGARADTVGDVLGVDVLTQAVHHCVATQRIYSINLSHNK